MEHLEVSELFAMLVVMLGAAKLVGALAQRVGQPAVLGELVAGIIVGHSVLGLVDTARRDHPHALGTGGGDPAAGDRAGDRPAVAHARGGDFVGGGGRRRGAAVRTGLRRVSAAGLWSLVAIMAGATLTATSVGITARVLSDLGRLRDVEGQIILGAAVIDDILGLIILTVVGGMIGGGAARASGRDDHGRRSASWRHARRGERCILPGWSACELDRPAGHADDPRPDLALGLAWMAEKSGSAMIIGAFVAGVLLAKTSRAHEIEKGVTAPRAFLRPAVLRSRGRIGRSRRLEPDRSATADGPWWWAALIVCGVVGKMAAGYAPFWFRGDKGVVGVGMIPRGEVGLIFAQMGLPTGVFDAGMFTGATLMVIVTTFLAPPLLKGLIAAQSVTQTRGARRGHRRSGDGGLSSPDRFGKARVGKTCGTHGSRV